MSEVIIKFEAENRDGVVAVGSYLRDAAKRLGIHVENCELLEEGHKCGMKISSGRSLLSKPTKAEMEQLSSQARRNGGRLSCQTKIEKPGEITIMSVDKHEETKTKEEEQREEYRKEFEDLPLEKKISNLVELEAIALSETFSFVLNSPYKAVGKVMDIMAEFGLSMDKEDEKAKRPKEHKKDEVKDKPQKKTAKKKAPAKKRTSKASSASKTSSKPADEGDAEEKKEV